MCNYSFTQYAAASVLPLEAFSIFLVFITQSVHRLMWSCRSEVFALPCLQ